MRAFEYCVHNMCKPTAMSSIDFHCDALYHISPGAYARCSGMYFGSRDVLVLSQIYGLRHQQWKK